MARRKTNTTKTSIRLYNGDTEIISQAFPAASYNKIIREHVHRLALFLREQLNQKGVTLAPPQLNINLEDLKNAAAKSDDE